MTETSQEKLAYSARQLCSTGYDVIGEDLSPGDNDRQFVDNELRCKPYHFNLFGADLAGIVPY